jgi:hypothetical protein
MRRLIAPLVITLIASGAVFAAGRGTASGELVVGRDRKPLSHAWVIEKDSLLRIILATGPLEEAVLYDHDALQKAVAGGGVSALVIRLDEDREADSVLFFDSDLPAGLEVRQVATFKPRRSPQRALAGRVAMKDDGYSFSYDASFDAPIVVQVQTIEPLAADATPAEHALWRLEQMEINFDQSGFRDAIIEGNADTVGLFLQAGMPIETGNAIREAVDRGKTDVIRLLLEKGADANDKDHYGQSLVMTAVSGNHPGVLDLLIAAGADVSAPNQYRITPLAVAAEQGHLHAVKALLAAGAKINARDTSGGTALSVAILRGYTEIVETLLAAKADVQRDKEDLLALAADKPEIKAMLEKAMAATK